ncbi:S8 family serine peptidase [Wukongibacter baidiensis]|uniref:S8 family serine peptidase n=1 Tax=Wukongibacter baidiensis TaxID=1723361 RepID=UPI003D7F75AA
MDFIHVALIDDGINEKYYNLKPLKYNIEITDDLKIMKRENYNPYKKSHGTVCAAIVEKYCKKVILSSIKIINNNGRSNKYKLIKALEWCIEKNIPIINLSIGTVSYNDKRELKSIVDLAHSKGIIIIAANKNEDIITYPASFHNVIGVRCDTLNNLMEGEFFYNLEPKDTIEITADSTHTLVNYLGEKKKTKKCNSYAAPLITAKIVNLLSVLPYITLRKAKEKLWKESRNHLPGTYFYELYYNLEWIKNAVIFDMKKKHYLSESYTFNVKEVIDINCSNKIETFFQEIICYLDSNLKKLSVIDTIIVDVNEIDLTDYYGILEEELQYISTFKKNILVIGKRVHPIQLGDALNRYRSSNYIDIVKKDAILSNSNIERTLISIYDPSGEKMYYTMYRLIQSFMNDGYNAIGLTNSIYGVFYGYILLNELKSASKSKLYYEISNTINFYNCDLAIYGVTLNSNDNEEKSIIEKVVNLDSDILIVIDKYKEYEKFRLYCDKYNKKLFFVSSDLIDNNKKAINFYSSDYVNRIYKEILSKLL